ncbi:MAG: hypothetical protein AAGA12_10155 [Pseudomonadota bacterium]
MKPALFILPVFAAACVDAGQDCHAKAVRDLSIIRALIAETEATVARGYAIRTETSSVVYSDFCLGTALETSDFAFCNRTAPVTKKRPVAIDLSAEQGKLEDLKVKEADLARKAAIELQTCKIQSASSGQGIFSRYT